MQETPLQREEWKTLQAENAIKRVSQTGLEAARLPLQPPFA